MHPAYEVSALAAAAAASVVLCRKPIGRSLRQARIAWREDPVKMGSKIVVGFAVGQGVFWLIGYDQLGLFMDTKKQFGIGAEIAEAVARRLPEGTAVYVTVKALEIITDALRIPIEGAVYRRYQFAPDIVATIVTQPLWTTLEVAEKTAGVFLHPERVTDPKQLLVSIACIYGNLFRYVLAAVIWKKGDAIYRIIGGPLEGGVKRLLRKG